jgi:hypothetical protein
MVGSVLILLVFLRIFTSTELLLLSFDMKLKKQILEFYQLLLLFKFPENSNSHFIGSELFLIR